MTTEQATRILDQDAVLTEDAVALLRRLGLVTGPDGIVTVPEMLRRALRATLGPAESHDIAARARPRGTTAR